MDKRELLISLGDENLKALGEVLGSKSCVRILDLLGGSTPGHDSGEPEGLTVSDISGKLGMKLNTVDYNVKKLVRAGLIEKADHWWSVKGRRMIVYRVADKRIVISPRRNVAKKFLWVLGLTGAVGLWLRQWGTGNGQMDVKVVNDAVFRSSTDMTLVSPAVPEVESLAVDVGVRESVVQSVGFWGGLAGFEWFLLGAWSAIVLFFVYSLIVERRG